MTLRDDSAVANKNSIHLFLGTDLQKKFFGSIIINNSSALDQKNILYQINISSFGLTDLLVDEGKCLWNQPKSTPHLKGGKSVYMKVVAKKEKISDMCTWL